MKKRRNKIFLLVIAAVTVSLIAFGFWPRPVRVELATVSRGPLQVTVDEDGKTRIKERYTVSASVGGRLQRIDLQPGDEVKAGETIIASIEPSDPEMLDARTRAEAEARFKAAGAARAQAGPRLESARTSYEFAKTDLDRARRLYSSNVVSRAEFDSAEQKERLAADGLRAAEFALRIADFELEQANAALLQRYDNAVDEPASVQFAIRSPIDGNVLRLFQESATVVTPGTRLIEVGDPQDLEIEIDVLSTDAVRIKPGAKVSIEHWGGEAPLEARVRLVEPSGFTKISALGVEEQRVNVIADFLKMPDARFRLGDNFRVEARLVVSEAENVVKAPIGSLFRSGNDWAVFRVNDRRATMAKVHVGMRNAEEAEILAGVAESDRVVLYPGDKIRTGTRVSPRQAAD